MQRAEREAVSLACFDMGTGQPVPCIHGTFVTDAFQPLVSEPALGGYRLVTHHRRGYAGSSPVPGPCTVSDQVADARSLLRRPGIDRTHVVGHSLGGSIVLHLALAATEVVQSLVLLEPAPFVGSSAEVYRASLRQSVDRYHDAGAAIAVADSPGALAQAVADAVTCGPDMALLDWSCGETKARRSLHPALAVFGGGSETLAPRLGETLFPAGAPAACRTLRPPRCDPLHAHRIAGDRPGAAGGAC